MHCPLWDFKPQKWFGKFFPHHKFLHMEDSRNSGTLKSGPSKITYICQTDWFVMRKNKTTSLWQLKIGLPKVHPFHFASQGSQFSTAQECCPAVGLCPGKPGAVAKCGPSSSKPWASPPLLLGHAEPASGRGSRVVIESYLLLVLTLTFDNPFLQNKPCFCSVLLLGWCILANPLSAIARSAQSSTASAVTVWRQGTQARVIPMDFSIVEPLGHLRQIHNVWNTLRQTLPEYPAKSLAHFPRALFLEQSSLHPCSPSSRLQGNGMTMNLNCF